MTSTLSLDNQVLRSYLFFSCLLVLKMLFMSPLTGLKRIAYKVFINPEDGKVFKAVPTTDDRIERVRRAHLNDLENIPLFFVAGLIYTLSNPGATTAKVLFIIYTLARYFHSFVYAVFPIPQPARGLSWGVGFPHCCEIVQNSLTELKYKLLPTKLSTTRWLCYDCFENSLQRLIDDDNQEASTKIHANGLLKTMEKLITVLTKIFEMASVSTALSLENEIVRKYLFYSSILILKMLFMSILTSSKRIKYKAFANSEDGKRYNAKTKLDDNVERVRRAHLNDLENIPLFFISAFIYILTDPAASTAKLLFLVYTVARVTHTFVYAVVPIPQPARGLSWGIGFAITGYMTINGLIHFLL